MQPRDAVAAGELLVIKLGGAAADHQPSLTAFTRELAALAAGGRAWCWCTAAAPR